MGSWSGASSCSSDPFFGSHTPPKSFPGPRSSPPFVTASPSVSSSAAAFVSSTRPRLTSPFHRAKPSLLRGLRHVVDCRVRSPAAMPSHPLLFILSRVGGGGPSSKFLGLLWSSTDPATFDGPPVFALPPFSRSRRFFRVSPLFFGVPPGF